MKGLNKVLVIGDGGCPTGFARVNHEIIKGLPEGLDIHHLAVNYKGDPHPYSHMMYPAILGGDQMGYGRIPEFADKDFDLIFILNDVWVIKEYLRIIKESWSKIPPIVVYIPVDAEEFSSQWFSDFDIVTTVVAYTNFGKGVIEEAYPKANCVVIPHGTNQDDFFPIDKHSARRLKFRDFPELMDAFIVLNANRNQPRKMIDVSIEGFALFAENKPEDVLYYHHAGLIDAGWNVPGLISRFNLQDRFILTSNTEYLQNVSVPELNIIYNVADVGINTSLGEGWGLTNTEHAVTGAAQIVPNHSACAELFGDCGLLIPTITKHTYPNTLTVGKLVRAEDVAEQLEKIYSEPGLLENLSKKCQMKFSQYEYSWEYVAKRFYEEFIKACQ